MVGADREGIVIREFHIDSAVRFLKSRHFTLRPNRNETKTICLACASFENTELMN